MIVWCQLCETNTVDVHPDDALHESFTERPLCGECDYTYLMRCLLGVTQAASPGWTVAVEIDGELHLQTFNKVTIHGNSYSYSNVPEIDHHFID